MNKKLAIGIANKIQNTFKNLIPNGSLTSVIKGKRDWILKNKKNKKIKNPAIKESNVVKKITDT
tara:strand:- start:80 stop:271 length:192 start_codon:yes stop_codon:yes gene_type:complete